MKNRGFETIDEVENIVTKINQNDNIYKNIIVI